MGDASFNRGNVNELWQELTLNFDPERAQFTEKRYEGEEFAEHLYSSYPVLAHRELSNMLDEFLFPDDFFSIHVDDEDLDEDDENRKYLEYITDIQMRAMTDPIADLITARGETTRDFVSTGNGVIEFGKTTDGNALLFKNHPLWNSAWSKNADGKIDCFHLNWNPTARQLERQFGDKVSKEVKKALEKDPEKEFPCRRAVLPSRLYDYKSKMGRRFPFVSLYIERDTQTVLEEVGQNYFPYIVPRWRPAASARCPIGTSMVTDIALPDGRTLQVVMRTLREAGESYVNPPLIAMGDAIRNDIALYPGGITIADIEYDERLGEVLRPITQNASGFPIGLDIATALKEDIRNSFFLDKIQLPEITHQMTATEVRRRVQEHIRAAAPISKPIQKEYLHPLCDGVFNLMMSEGAFPIEYMPESLQERDIKFKFRSPLDQLSEENEADIYIDVRDTIWGPAVQLDPSLKSLVNIEKSTRDAMRAKGWKADWFNSPEAIEQERAAMQQEMEAQQAMEELGAAGEIAEQAGKGVNELANAGVSVEQAMAE